MKANSSPWIDHEVNHQSNKKETARRKAKKSKKDRDFADYKEQNKILRNMIDYKHKQYINECSNDINNNPQRFWNLASAKTKSKSYPADMKLDDKTASCPAEKAKLFNDFFCSVFTASEDNMALPHIEPTISPHLNLITITVDEVYKTLKLLDTHKAQGPDGLPTKVLKECAATLAPSLTAVFNQSLSEGMFPEQWKTANVCPIFKKGARRDI